MKQKRMKGGKPIETMVELHVACTSGILAQDLAPLGFRGRQKIFFELEVMNIGREMKVDFIRLVSSLTEEEKVGLIGPPYRLFKQDVPKHLYQRLEALCAARPGPG